MTELSARYAIQSNNTTQTVHLTSPAAAPAGAADLGFTYRNPLDLNVADLHVPRMGKVHHDPRSGLPLVVHDPLGQEIQWVTRALRHLQGEALAPASLESYAECMLRGLRVVWAAGYDPVNLTGIEFSVVRRWLLMCLRHNEPPRKDTAVRHLQPTTVNNTVTAMRRIYDAAVNLGLVASNPVAAFDDPQIEPLHDQLYDTGFRTGRRRRLAKVQEKVIVTLTEEQLALLREQERRPLYRAIWHLMLDSGPRISEVLSLTLDHYHPDRGTGQVVGKGLGGERRTIPISHRTLDEIDAYLAHLESLGVRLASSQPMFLSVQRPYPPLTYSAVYQTLRYRLKSRRVHPHALRHTAATEMLHLLGGTPEENLLYLRIILGHKSLSTTERYLHTSIEEAVIAHIEARARPPDPAHPTLTATYGPEELALLAEIRNSTGDDK